MLLSLFNFGGALGIGLAWYFKIQIDGEFRDKEHARVLRVKIHNRMLAVKSNVPCTDTVTCMGALMASEWKEILQDPMSCQSMMTTNMGYFVYIWLIHQSWTNHQVFLFSGFLTANWKI